MVLDNKAANQQQNNEATTKSHCKNEQNNPVKTTIK